MKTTVTLETKEVRIILAKFLRIPLEQVVPQRYSFSIEGLKEAEIEERIRNGLSAEKDEDHD